MTMNGRTCDMLESVQLTSKGKRLYSRFLFTIFILLYLVMLRTYSCSVFRDHTLGELWGIVLDARY